ncbi:hypothetical protein [Streptomyces olivaceus]|uniref:hypothetical protein n=1 Tax=Streptomyces olivaceus TaxID=47716 RepID=UPI001CCDB975|nr:hypothetical protein [Streptomyces olivaceus]
MPAILKCRITEHDAHPQDAAAGRTLPVGYWSLDVQIASVSYAPPPAVRQLPWNVLSTGIRCKDRPGTPTRVPDLSVLADLLPFQVEIGCGTSVEAGIPPLHRLHEIYRVTDRQGHEPREHRFTLSPTADTLLHEVLTEPEEKTAEFVEMFRACFLAEPTPAMWALKELKDAGHLVGPVITNNFDVLAARAGLDECFIRRYDQAVPDVEWVDGAKALLVVGLHADRRKVQARPALAACRSSTWTRKASGVTVSSCRTRWKAPRTATWCAGRPPPRRCPHSSTCSSSRLVDPPAQRGPRRVLALA